LDQILTPLSLEAIGPVSLLGEWEIYASLRMQGKLVDLIYFPEGQHIHQKPLERLASQQCNVDWFRFWLQGYERADVSRRTQYERWERMRMTTTRKAEPIESAKTPIQTLESGIMSRVSSRPNTHTVSQDESLVTCQSDLSSRKNQFSHGDIEISRRACLHTAVQSLRRHRIRN
jgi:hypothetical protein